MKPVLILALAALSGPALAQTHEPVTGALSGRSPHTLMRPIAHASAPCDAVRASVPTGKAHAAYRPDPSCTATRIVARDGDERLLVGR